MSKPIVNDQIYSVIKTLLIEAREKVYRHINFTMVTTYWNIGKTIVEEEQRGKDKAEYGKYLLQYLSKRLTQEFGKGFSRSNLEYMRLFYLTYKNQQVTISQTVSGKSKENPFKLSWSHYVFLIRLDEAERKFYEIEAVNQGWSVRELERQFNSSFYERLALSRDKKQIKELSEKGLIVQKPQEAIKEPYVLEFLGLKEDHSYSEQELEAAIINKIEHFMLELGKGFLFVGRQVRFTFNEEHYYVDLVFYNRLLKCFVLIDLKIGKLKHQDIGQMQMYVNYYDRKMKSVDENKTVGIILCKEANKSIVEFTLPKNNKQIFAKQYKLYLPSKSELKKQLEE